MDDSRFLADGEDQYDGPIAILRTFVLHSRTKVLSGLAALSYVAGRAGDDEWAWAREADDALIDALFSRHAGLKDGGTWHSEWFRIAKGVLSDAFQGGQAQRRIDLEVVDGKWVDIYHPRQPEAAAVCEPAMAVARAYATIHESDIICPKERHREVTRSEVGYIATKIAQRFAVTDAEAAYCALKALEERGFEASLSTAAWALDRAAAGRADREAEELRARKRAADVEAATALLFGATQ